ncbi:MAG: hypothetical protein Q9191_002179 [Dirinaria sp. TL-2023a]
MEMLRQGLLPRRLTQIYTDTKKSYEHVVRTNENWSNPRISTTYLKLRIQKDRLIAWGLEWADSGASQVGDIDGSLDRAGISDLVESIMTSINELLREAEGLRPQRALQLPGSFPDEKMFRNIPLREVDHSSKDLARLDDIVRDLTTSIDTLCDLSRSSQAIRQESPLPISTAPEQKAEKSHYLDIKAQPRFPTDQKPGFQEPASSVKSWSRIAFNRLRIPPSTKTPGPSPPSYEAVAASAEDRVPAYLKHEAGSQDVNDLPVILEYSSVDDSPTMNKSSYQRVDELLEILQASPLSEGTTYRATLRLLGWFEDPYQMRCGLIYEMPSFPLYELPNPAAGSFFSTSKPPQSLLSYLQHGADTDSTNMPSLEDRFRLAFNLASSVLYFHTKGVTHRNINSNNVLFFLDGQISASSEDKEWKEGVIRKPYLTAFDQAAEDAPNVLEEPFISSIYRHPRTVRGLRASFRPAYDLYSLGLILLEIGLWMPLSKLWKTRYTRADFKVRLQSVYIKKLAAKCGTTYMRIVDKCLRAADDHRIARRPSNLDGHMNHQSSRPEIDLYWDVVKPLERCCMIDDIEDTMNTVEAAASETVQSSDHQTTVSEKQKPFPVMHAPSEKAPEILKSPTLAEETELRQTETQSAGTAPTPRSELKEKSRQRCKCKVWSHEIPMACSAYWNATMAPKLDRILQKAIDRWESYSIDLFMSGETPEVARPTIYMMCVSTDKARKVLHYLNKERGLFDIKVVKGQISRSKAGKRRRPAKKGKKPSSNFNTTSQPVDIPNRRYQQRPACGASIGAFIDNHHLPPVSFGGTVLVNGEPYGMSVHHMLENEEVDYGLDETVDLHRCMASPGDGFEEPSAEQTRSTVPTMEALYPFEISDDEDEGYQSSEGDLDAWLSEILDSEDNDHLEQDEEQVDMGDTDGIEPGNGCELFVTQPAIDDVDEGFFPSEEDMDEEHLSSHGFGHVHASSGIKRWRRGGVSHEVDWALIEVEQHRARTANFIAGGARHCDHVTTARTPENETKASYPCNVAKADELGGLHVHALGRTSGLQAGRILPIMSMIKLPGRISSSQSWTVMGNFGAGGDSGAWVIDNASNRVCAHVLAFSELNNTAYIAPMEILLDDMCRSLKASVTLPTYPPASGTKATAVSAVPSGFSPPDTPPPSPPLATSPNPPTPNLETLSPGNSVAERRPSNTGVLRHVSTNHRLPQKNDFLDKDRGVGGEGKASLKRMSGGISARG